MVDRLHLTPKEPITDKDARALHKIISSTPAGQNLQGDEIYQIMWLNYIIQPAERRLGEDSVTLTWENDSRKTELEVTKGKDNGLNVRVVVSLFRYDEKRYAKIECAGARRELKNVHKFTNADRGKELRFSMEDDTYMSVDRTGHILFSRPAEDCFFFD